MSGRSILTNWPKPSLDNTNSLVGICSGSLQGQVGLYVKCTNADDIELKAIVRLIDGRNIVLSFNDLCILPQNEYFINLFRR